jgi:hypothetical protein
MNPSTGTENFVFSSPTDDSSQVKRLQVVASPMWSVRDLDNTGDAAIYSTKQIDVKSKHCVADKLEVYFRYLLKLFILLVLFVLQLPHLIIFFLCSIASFLFLLFLSSFFFHFSFFSFLLPIPPPYLLLLLLLLLLFSFSLYLSRLILKFILCIQILKK